jgi:hypothetical protein
MMSNYSGPNIDESATCQRIDKSTGLKEWVCKSAEMARTSNVIDRSGRGGGKLFEVGGKDSESFYRTVNINRSKGALKEMDTIVQEVMNAEQRMNEATLAIQRQFAEFGILADKYVKEVREFKTCVDLDLNHTLTQMKDLRKFFLSPEHQDEVLRLQEFASLCERLMELKNSGFLDAMTDTILSLELKNNR